ncbi:MAG: hypothetical protein JXR48_10100 [Candidatus Delongbacteria bacterium]|nr:hypothetical protein [Candidatus Delongbacteria bacterium]MBN2835306.1 hypothetical protein [Candidatus Delongbacteria bacterium]
MSLKDNTITVKCEKCGEEVNYSPYDFEFDIQSDKENMGKEDLFLFELNEKCKKCKHEHRIDSTAWIYPEGAEITFDKPKVYGCEVISGIENLKELIENN